MFAASEVIILERRRLFPRSITRHRRLVSRREIILGTIAMKSRGPLAVCSTANGHEGRSLCSEAFRKKQGEAPGDLVFG